MIGYDRVSTPADLAPSVLNQIALRELRWIPPRGSHAYMLGVRFGMRWMRMATLRFLCMQLYGAWVHGMLLAAAVAIHPKPQMKMPQGTAGAVH
jgi:hypothetical protein